MPLFAPSSNLCNYTKIFWAKNKSEGASATVVRGLVLLKRRKQAETGARRAFPAPFVLPKFVCWPESNCCDQYLTTTAESALNGIIVERASVLQQLS